MKIARLIDDRWQPETLPRRWAKKIPASTIMVDDKEVNIPEKTASISIAKNPELGWQLLQDVGYITAEDIASNTVAPILGDLPICNEFEQIDGGTIIDDWVTFAAEPLPEVPFIAAMNAAENRLLSAAKEYQEAHPQGLCGTSLHLIDRLLKYTEEQAPKAHASESWIREIYDELIARFALLRSTGQPPSYDYTDCGPKPHTIEELMAEEAGLVGV